MGDIKLHLLAKGLCISLRFNQQLTLGGALRHEMLQHCTRAPTMHSTGHTRHPIHLNGLSVAFDFLRECEYCRLDLKWLPAWSSSHPLELCCKKRNTGGGKEKKVRNPQEMEKNEKKKKKSGQKHKSVFFLSVSVCVYTVGYVCVCMYCILCVCRSVSTAANCAAP